MPDAIRPFIVKVFPPSGTTDLGRATLFDFKISDFGGSGLDAATLVVSVKINGGGAVALTNGAGVLQNGLGWDASYVRYYSETPASLADLRIQKDVLHAFDDTIELTLSMDDVDGNETTSVLTYVIRSDPKYLGASPTLLETELATAFANMPALETLRLRMVNNLVSDPQAANGPQRAARRMMQVLTRTAEQPFVRWTWEEDPDENKVPVSGGVSLEGLQTLDGPLIMDRDAAIRYLRPKLDSTYLEFIEDRSRANRRYGNLASAVLTLVVACRLRTNGDL
jgi:hypothetical protein